MKRMLTIRFMLFIFLFITVLYATYGIYYKIDKWGFSLKPTEMTPVWTIEGNISFRPTGGPIKVSMAIPSFGENFKILTEDVVAKGYEIRKENGRLIMETQKAVKKQNLYYRILLFDNEEVVGKTTASKPKKPQKPFYNEQEESAVSEILELSQQMEGDSVQKIIKVLNQLPPDPTVEAFLPRSKTQRAMSELTRNLLDYQGIPNRQIRGIKLEENKKTRTPDLMLEAYIDGKWKIYDLHTGHKGLPKNFIILQKGNDSLLDVEGGSGSSIKFSVLRSVQSTFSLAKQRAKLADNETNFKYSMYALPLLQQNTLKWFTIFPLGILLITLIRNVVGMHTMGTFTPMLLSMALIKTGFLPGLICFSLIIGLGFLIREALSKLNLLLVPRISVVVIFVILIMQAFTILGYRLNFDIISSALFFPIIITAWIVERASITLEEEGTKDCVKELLNTVFAAILIYFVINSSYIRHIMFAFNELNLVILAIIMLLGTYTGYRLTELKRFASLMKDKKNVK